MAPLAQLRIRNEFLQRRHFDRVAAHRRKLSVHIDRNARHHLIGVVVTVFVHGTEVGLAVRDRARVPWTSVGVEGQIFPVCADFGLRRSVRHDARAAGQRHHAVQQCIAAPHDLQHHIPERADAADLLLELLVRLVSPVGIEQLQRQLPLVFQRRALDLHRRIPGWVFQHHFDLLRQNLQIVAHRPELPI